MRLRCCPTKKTSKRPLFGGADKFGIACGGAVAISAKVFISAFILTHGAFSTLENTTIIGHLECSGAVTLGANGNFTGTIIGQAALSVYGGIFTGDFFFTALVMASATDG